MQSELAGLQYVLNSNLLAPRTLGQASLVLSKIAHAKAGLTEDKQRLRLGEFYTRDVASSHQRNLDYAERNIKQTIAVQQLVRKARFSLVSNANKDSSAMRTMAVLTMVFLPATAGAASISRSEERRVGKECPV